MLVAPFWDENWALLTKLYSIKSHSHFALSEFYRENWPYKCSRNSVINCTYHYIQSFEKQSLRISHILNIAKYLHIQLNTLYSRRLIFCVNSRYYRDAKFKSLPIISKVRNIDVNTAYRENKILWINNCRWPRENKVTRIISVSQ